MAPAERTIFVLRVVCLIYILELVSSFFVPIKVQRVWRAPHSPPTFRMTPLSFGKQHGLVLRGSGFVNKRQKLLLRSQNVPQQQEFRSGEESNASASGSWGFADTLVRYWGRWAVTWGTDNSSQVTVSSRVNEAETLSYVGDVDVDIDVKHVKEGNEALPDSPAATFFDRPPPDNKATKDQPASERSAVDSTVVSFLEKILDFTRSSNSSIEHLLAIDAAATVPVLNAENVTMDLAHPLYGMDGVRLRPHDMNKLEKAAEQDEKLFHFIRNLAFWKPEYWRKDTVEEQDKHTSVMEEVDEDVPAAMEEATTAALFALQNDTAASQAPTSSWLSGAAQIRDIVGGFFGSLDPAAGSSSTAGAPLIDTASRSFAMASSAAGTVASAVGGTLRSLGVDAADYDAQLEDARKAILQSIGVGARSRMDAYSPDFSTWPQFDMSLAIQLAEYAFDSYNNPAEGRWVTHPDGSRTAYLSADLIKKLYSGILMIQVHQPRLRSDYGAADAFLDTGMPDYDASSTSSSNSNTQAPYVRLRMHEAVQDAGVASTSPMTGRKTSLSGRWNDTVFMYTSRGQNSSDAMLSIEVREPRAKGFPFAEDAVIATARMPLATLVSRDRKQRHAAKLYPADVLVDGDGGGMNAWGGVDDEGDALAQASTTPVMDHSKAADFLITNIVDSPSPADTGTPTTDDAAITTTTLVRREEEDATRRDVRLMGTPKLAYPWYKDDQGKRWGISEYSASWPLVVSPGAAGLVSVDGREGEGEGEGRVGGMGGVGRLAVMTKKEVLHWLETIGMAHLSKKFDRNGIDGRSLLELARLSTIQPEVCYKMLEEKFGMQRFGDVLSFAQELRALIRLAAFHDAQSPLEVAVSEGIRRAYTTQEEEAEQEKREEAGWQSVIRWGGGLLGRKKDASNEPPKDASKKDWRDSGKHTSGDVDKERSCGVIKVETQYFGFDGGDGSSGPHVRSGASPTYGAEQDANPFSPKLTNALLMQRWGLLTKIAMEHNNRAMAMATQIAEAMCFIEVNSTDTHMVIWREGNRVIVSFRGTDINWRDFVTDLSAFQVNASWLFDKEQCPIPECDLNDNGESSSYTNSVNEAFLSPTEESLLSEGDTSRRPTDGQTMGPMTHFGFTAAYESVRFALWRVIRTLIPGDGTGYTIFLTGHSLGAALATLCAVDVRVRMSGVNVVMYNFGSPKVGNDEFVVKYNKLVRNSFRVVNDADVFARLPRNRGIGSLPGLTNYYHVGRTVLTSPERATAWIEGVSQGEDPLKDRWEDLSDLLDAEVALMRTLIDGRSWQDHVENGYHQAMLQCLAVMDPIKAQELNAGLVAPLSNPPPIPSSNDLPQEETLARKQANGVHPANGVGQTNGVHPAEASGGSQGRVLEKGRQEAV